MIELDSSIEDDVLLLKPVGSIDSTTEEKFHRLLFDATINFKGVVRFDGSGVQYINSAAIGYLIGLHTRLQADGGQLRIVNPSPKLEDALRTTHLTETLHVEYLNG